MILLMIAAVPSDSGAWFAKSTNDAEYKRRDICGDWFIASEDAARPSALAI
jgi:hypothetical protein